MERHAPGPAAPGHALPDSPERAAFAGGERDLVKLDQDHPGFRDPVYRSRRNAIAHLALEYREGQPVPHAEYTDVEHGVWREVWQHLIPLHEERASRAYLDAARRLALDTQRIPQLEEVNQQLLPVTGFSMKPVAGLVSPRTFLTFLARRVFLSTQYVRHHSRPLYTPEPDVIHELVGHAATLISDELCDLNLLFGEAMVRARDPQREEEITRLYWYTIEFGLLDEGGPKALGAGLLSSFGELGRCLTESELRPFDLDDVIATPYDPTDYQKVLYVADSLDQIRKATEAWLARG